MTFFHLDYKLSSMVNLSVVIITFNEERNIGRCIESVLDIADEIVVVDSFSTDRTPEICQKYGVRFMTHEFKGHIQQKNYALEQATYDHVLSLDADEAPDKELIENIRKAKENFEYDGYKFNRLTNYVGHWVKHCGWYPDTKLRLLNRKKGRWGGKNPHDIIMMEEGSREKHLSGNLLHYSYVSIADHVRQTNKFTTIAAKVFYEEGKRSSIVKIVTRPPLKFLRDYFFKLGFLDGRYGFIICFINALSAFLKYSKIYELESGKEID